LLVLVSPLAARECAHCTGLVLDPGLLTLALSLTEGTEDGKQLAKAFLEYSKQNGGEYGI
jgi:hypothetical protein